jgi:hypothetical protein
MELKCVGNNRLVFTMDTEPALCEAELKSNEQFGCTTMLKTLVIVVFLVMPVNYFRFVEAYF